MLKEALEWLQVNTSTIETLQPQSGDRFNRPLYLPPREELAQPLPCTTLRALVDYVAANRDGLDLDEIVVGAGPTGADVLGPLRVDHQREHYLAARAPARRHPWGEFMSQDRFLIWLLSGFVSDEPLLQLAELVKVARSEQEIEARDSGVSQTLTVKRGARVAVETVPPIWTLAPYRTFSALEQPGSAFLLRIDNAAPPRFALFEADGGDWELQASKSVRGWIIGAFDEENLDIPVIGG